MRTPSDPRYGTLRTQVVIADDHPLGRAGLRAMLAGEPNLEIVGEAATGQEAVDLCCALNPDLVLMDIRMPELDGFAATRTIMQQCPTHVLIVTISAIPDLIAEARQAGAMGYVFKDASHQEFVTAIRKVLNGERLF